MKKVIAFFMCVVLLLCLAGCTGKESKITFLDDSETDIVKKYLDGTLSKEEYEDVPFLHLS